MELFCPSKSGSSFSKVDSQFRSIVSCCSKEQVCTIKVSAPTIHINNGDVLYEGFLENYLESTINANCGSENAADQCKKQGSQDASTEIFVLGKTWGVNVDL